MSNLRRELGMLKNQMEIFSMWKNNNESPLDEFISRLKTEELVNCK